MCRTPLSAAIVPLGVASASAPLRRIIGTIFSAPGARWNQSSPARKLSSSIWTDWAKRSVVEFQPPVAGAVPFDRCVDRHRHASRRIAKREVKGVRQNRARLRVEQPRHRDVVGGRAEPVGIGRIEKRAEKIGRGDLFICPWRKRQLPASGDDRRRAVAQAGEREHDVPLRAGLVDDVDGESRWCPRR